VVASLKERRTPMEPNVIGKKTAKKQKPKQLWYGVFKGKRQVYYLYCYAYTPKQARIAFCRQIARKQGVDDWIVLRYFPEGADNYIIKLEMEFTEDD
jgi:phenylpropionate dioxygenase-like ring-hydroxylating dioxygenase large terminal subunit